MGPIDRMRKRDVPLSRRIATLTITALMLAAAPAEGQIRLFPDLGSEPAPAQPAPASPQSQSRPQTEGEASAPKGFRIEGLAAPEIDAVGLAGPAEGGFGESLWAGSDGELVLALLSNLPVASENPPLTALTRRLLMTGAPLRGVLEPGSVLAARADRLLAMGDLDGAAALLERVPSTRSDSQIARLVVQTALLRDDAAAACGRAGDIAPTSEAAFWAKVAIYCRLVDGDRDGAMLGLDLLRDQGLSEDAAFFALATMVAQGQPATVPLPPGGPTPLHVAMYRLADLPLPRAVLADASPEMLAVAAREPRLVADDPLAVAERAFLFGALPADDLAARYRERSSGDAQDLRNRIATAWDPDTRALAYDVLPGEQVSERGQLLDALWRRAQGYERFLVARLFAQPYAELPVERGRLRVAPSLARALLAAERPIPAARWFSLVSTDAGIDPLAGDDLAELTPLFALAGFGGSVAVPVFDDRSMAGWLAGNEAALAQLGPLLGLLEGIGLSVPATAWQQLIVAPVPEAVPAPPAPLWGALAGAATRRQVGETVLLALHMMGGRPEAAHPQAVAAALRGLRSVGLDQEARDIAIATALAMGM